MWPLQPSLDGNGADNVNIDDGDVVQRVAGDDGDVGDVFQIEADDVGGVGDVGVLTILFSKSSFVKLAGKWALFVSLIMMFT